MIPLFSHLDKDCRVWDIRRFLNMSSMTWTAPAQGEQRKGDMLQMRCLDHGDGVLLMHAGGAP